MMRRTMLTAVVLLLGATTPAHTSNHFWDELGEKSWAGYIHRAVVRAKQLLPGRLDCFSEIREGVSSSSSALFERLKGSQPPSISMLSLDQNSRQASLAAVQACISEGVPAGAAGSDMIVQGTNRALNELANAASLCRELSLVGGDQHFWQMGDYSDTLRTIARTSSAVLIGGGRYVLTGGATLLRGGMQGLAGLVRTRAGGAVMARAIASQVQQAATAGLKPVSTAVDCAKAIVALAPPLKKLAASVVNWFRATQVPAEQRTKAIAMRAGAAALGTAAVGYAAYKAYKWWNNNTEKAESQQVAVKQRAGNSRLLA